MKSKPPYFWPLLALVAVLLIDLILAPSFFAFTIRDGRIYGSLIDILNLAAPIALIAVGMTLVIATGGVDLSVGAVMAIGGAVAACVIARPSDCILNGLQLPPTAFYAVAAGLVAAALCGIFNGFLVSRVRVQPIVATLLLMVAGRGVAQLLTNGQIVTFTDKTLSSLGSGGTLGLPNPLWIAAFVALAVGILCRRTALGLFVEATGENEEAARIAGLRTRAIIGFAYVLCAVCAGLAGILAAADIRAADANNAGLYAELDAILAVAIGGTAMTGGRFSLAGTLIGAVLMQTVTTTILTRGVSAELTFVLKALIVIGVCLLQSPVLRSRLRNPA